MGLVNGCLYAVVNKSYQKHFNTTLMRNIKKLSKKLIALLFSNYIFLKIVYKSIRLGDLLTFSFIICVYNLGCTNTDTSIDIDMDMTQ